MQTIGGMSTAAPARVAAEGMTTQRLRIGLIGCGDVAHRRYLPALSLFADRVVVVGCCDPKPEAADRAAEAARAWSPGVRAYTELADLLRDGGLDAAINITPAPVHATVSQACLEAGVHVYSEKPIASTVADADRLIATAREGDLLLLCAPAVAVSRRMRWIGEIASSGRLGRLTLIVAHHADPGPAAWREYTSDPSVFYGPGVGPVFDHGIYRLHAMTGLLGPVRRVQAMGTIGNPTRIVRAGPLAGQTIPVTSPDHVLINMEFANGALGQLLASFGTPSTLAPWLEFHFDHGTVSFGGRSHEKDAPISIYFDDDSQLGLEGWVHDIQLPPPGEPLPVVESGVAHFVSCLQGKDQPVLTAEHARHVLDIILKAYDSIADGESHNTETTF